MPEQTLWRTLVEPILRTNNLKFSYPSQDPEPTNFDVVMVEREIGWRIENYGVDLYDLLAKLKQGITEGPTHGGAPLDLRKLFSGFLDWCVREKKLRAFLRCLAENDLVQRLVGAPTVHGNNRRDAVNTAALDDRSEQHFRWMMEQDRPELSTEDQEWCDKLEDSWKDEWEKVDRFWEPLVRGAASCPDIVEYQRRVEELEARREGILADRRKLFETQTGVYSASEADQALSREPSADESATIQEAPAREKKDSLSHTVSAFKVTDGKHFRLSEGIGARGNGLGGRGQEYGFKRN